MRHLLLAVLFIGLSCTITPYRLSASTVLHKTNMIDLSNNAIICMHQDTDGYLWIGTYDGLNLFNGKDTYVYRFELNNKNSLCSNIIHKISDAEPGYLWISTSLGINKFSLKERIVTESYPGYSECDLLATDSFGNTLAICKDNRISCYSAQSDGFRDLPRDGISPANVKALFTAADEHFYMILANGKIKRLTPEFFTDNINLLSDELPFHDKEILYAFHENKQIFIVDAEKKLYRYPTVYSQEKTYLHDLSALINEHGNISHICTFQSQIYLAFRDGVVLDLINPEFIHNLGIGVFCLMKDKRQEILWIGTDGQGIRMFYDKPDLFGSILLKDLPIKLQNPIRSLYTDEDKSLWFGTKGDGVVRIQSYDSLYNKPIPAKNIRHFTTYDGLGSNRVYCFHKSKRFPIVWIGTEGPGISYYSTAEKRIKTIVPPVDMPNIRYVHAISEVNDSTIWLATTGEGLLEVTLRQGTSAPEISRIVIHPLKNGEKNCKEIQAMIYDQDSILHLGSRGGYGMIRFNILNKQYSFLQSNNPKNSPIGDVLSICQTKNYSFYIGASSGLTQIQYASDQIYQRQFDRNSGIANDMIHGICEASDGCIWLSTNKGLSKYNPLNNFFHNYLEPNFDVTEFSDDAYWKCTTSGRLFFGGINGLVWVNEPILTENQYQPELFFFEMQTDKMNYPLHKDSERKGITIPAKTQSFTISFVAPDYINGENYEYAYQLQNHSSAWIELQKNNKATFMNIPHGSYQLKVRYRNDVNDSHAKEYVLPIEILPPLYLSPIAYLAYVLLAIVLLLGVAYQIIRQIKKKQQQIADRIKEEQKEQLYEAKLNFFTHITHELCTPLTLINGVENYIHAYAATKEDLKLEKYTHVLRENVNELNDLIQEILDFRKAEDAGFGNFQIRMVSVTELLQTQFEWFHPLSETNQVRFSLNAPNELMWNTDPVYLKKILSNLISNAFKYTEKGGEIRVSVSISDNRLVIKVHNTGQGIREEDRQSIFDRYRILETLDNEAHNTRQVARNGIGLFICQSLVHALRGQIEIRSEVNQYAEFIVTLPMLEIIETIETHADAPQQSEEEENEKPVVLVIDDHKDIVWLISEALSSSYKIQKAYNAEEALDFLNQQTPSLIITDIMMPNMDGLELVGRIKENKYMRHIPLIIVSAKISSQEQAAGLNLGADAYLTKPFSPIVLQSVVNRIMSRQKELKDYFYSPESAIQYTDGQLIHQEDKEFMDMVTTIIKENIGTEGLGPDLIAEALHINTRALYRRFKKISTLTPTDFIKDYRLSFAAQLLVNTTMSVQEIIYNVGISNKSYFYREFARKYDMTPKEYRNKR